MKKITILFVLFLGLVKLPLNAQVNVRDSATQGVIINASLGYNWVGGDMSDWFGGHMSAGLDVYYKTKSNWLFGGGFDYMFGTNVKNGYKLLEDLITEDGNIIGAGGDYATIKPFLRSWAVQAKLGKIFPFIGHNPNSGLLFMGGVGYLQHKIKIDHGDAVFQLNEPYIKGYDHFTSGLLISEYIAFYHSGNKRTLNFTAGFQFMQGFTQNRREYNYDTRSADTENKLDLFFGIRASWFLPIYDKNAQKYYYR